MTAKVFSKCDQWSGFGQPYGCRSKWLHLNAWYGAAPRLYDRRRQSVNPPSPDYCYQSLRTPPTCQRLFVLSACRWPSRVAASYAKWTDRCLKQDPYWEADSFSANEDILHTLWKSKFGCRVQWHLFGLCVQIGSWDGACSRIRCCGRCLDPNHRR